MIRWERARTFGAGCFVGSFAAKGNDWFDFIEAALNGAVGFGVSALMDYIWPPKENADAES